MKKLLALALLCAGMTLHAQTAIVTGTHVYNGTGGLLSTGTWCFRDDCLTVTNGAISGAVHQGAGSIIVSNGATIYLTIPNVSITNTVFAPDHYAVSGTAFGMGTPVLSCVPGAVYYQTDASNARFSCINSNGASVWSGGGSSGGTSTVAYLPTGLDGFGDSVCAGYYSNNINNTLGSQGVAWLAGQNTPGGLTQYCVGGSQAPDVGQLQIFPLAAWKYGSAPRFLFNTGLNDRLYTTANQQAIYQMSELADQLEMLIPAEYQVGAASGLVTKTGTWTLNTARIGSNNPTLESSTNGSTITASITTTGGPVYAIYEQQDGNVGTATVKIDGTAVGTLNSGNAGTAGNCICTSTLATTLAPMAVRYGGIAAGTHTVVLTVAGATGSGMGFSFVKLATTGAPSTAAPGSGGPPHVYTGGVLRTPGYTAGSIDDTIDAITQANVSLLQNDGLDTYYVCGVAGDYAKFPSSAVQPAGCGDVTAFYVDNTSVPISTTAWNSTTGLLTVISSAAIPATVHVGDSEIIALTTNEPSISNAAYWQVVSISGSTLTLSQVGFSGTTWAATSDTNGIVSKNFYKNPHPNSAGYFRLYQAYNHAMNLPGGQSAAKNLNLPVLISGSATSFVMTGLEPIVEMSCASNAVTVTLPPLTTPNNGPFIIRNRGAGSCGILAGTGTTLGTGMPAALGPLSSMVVHFFENTWVWDATPYGLPVGAALSSGTTIYPSGGIQHITGTSAIATIGLPAGFSANNGGCLAFIADGAWTTTTAGNIAAAYGPMTAGTLYHACYDGSKWYIK